MRVSHGVSAVFDDPSLVSCAGLTPVLASAERCGLHRLVAETLTLSGAAAANAAVPALVAGMVAGADSIEDIDLLRHGGLGRLFGGSGHPRPWVVFCVPSGSATSASSTRSPPGLLSDLAGHTPLLRDAEQLVLVDVDDTVKATYG